MRTNSRLAVGSPTWRVAVVMAATALVAVTVAGASFAGSQILATTAFIVDDDGSGTHLSIGAAVAEAEDGTEIIVRPGNYEEAFELDKTLTIRGDGPIEDIVVTAPEDGPSVTLQPGAPDWYAIHVTGGEPVIEGLTFSGEPSAIVVSGGYPTLQTLVFEDVGWPFPTRGLATNGSSIVVSGLGTEALVKGNELRNGGPIAVLLQARADIEENQLLDGPHLFLRGSGEGMTVTDNDIVGTLRFGVNVHGLTGALVKGNTFTDVVGTAIRVKDGQGSVVADNVVEGGPDTTYGVSVEGDQDGLQLIDNVVTGARQGVGWSGGGGSMTGNTFSSNIIGIGVGLGGSPVLTGNTACDNESANIAIPDESSATAVRSENDFCEEPAT